MRISFEGPDIKINALDLFTALPKEERFEFIRGAILWDEELFAEAVKSLVLEEYASPTFNDHIFKAREKMMELLPLALRDVVKKLRRDAEQARLQMETNRQYMWKLSHNWPWACEECGARLPKKPEEPKFPTLGWGTPSEEEITELIGEDAREKPEVFEEL